MVSFTLATPTPFLFHAVIKSHGWVQLAPFHYDEATGVLTYVTQLQGGRVLEIGICEMDGGVLVQADGSLDAAERQDIVKKVTWILGLEQDFSSFYAVSKKEPRLAHVEAEARGRMLRSGTLFEDVIKTVLTTNTLWSATKRMTEAVVTQFGARLPHNPEKQAFPTPEKLASATEEVLRAETRLGYRAPYVLDIARSIASGAFDLEALKCSDLATPELRKLLLELKGVGDYAAANLLLILGRGDYLPIDSWAKKLVSEEWYGGEPVSAHEVAAAFEDWGEWKGLAYWFWDWQAKQAG